MKTAAAVGVMLGGMCLWGLRLDSQAAEQPNEKAVKAFMRGKLDASQQVLEGLVTEDFKLIELGGDRMRVMSLRAEWNVLKTPAYVQYSNEFQRAAQQLSRAAKEKKLDAAALFHLQLTLTCINCHKHVRGVKLAAAPKPQAARSVSLISPRPR